MHDEYCTDCNRVRDLDRSVEARRAMERDLTLFTDGGRLSVQGTQERI